MGYRLGAKTKADGLDSLDVNWLNRHGDLTPGRVSSIWWSRGGQPSGNGMLRAESDRLALIYGSRSYGCEWQAVEESVRLTWTRCHFGGRRPWFICPGAGCGRRVAKLYADGRYFLCRHCYDLAYESQAEELRDRLLRKMQKARRRLGGSGNLTGPFPDKPKGMHWATYSQLHRLAEQIERSMWGEAANRLEKLRKRCT